MQIRRLTEADARAAACISAISFHGRLSDGPFPLGTNPRYGAFTENGEIASTMVNVQYEVYYGAHIVRMGGIGGVCTLPEYRGQSGVREIFRLLLRDARENGEVFSSLYPFSHEFYRKFGYEFADPMEKNELPVRALRRYAHDGWARLATEADAAQTLRLYRAFASGYRFMAYRSEESQKGAIANHPLEDQSFCYLLGRGEKTLSYVKYVFERKDEESRLVVRDFGFEDREGLLAMLGFLGRMSADYRTLAISLPDSFRLSELLAEPYDHEIKRQNSLMVRLTNVERALALMPRPAGCSFVIEVEDDFLPENGGVFRVDDAGALRAKEPADLKLDQRTLAQLLCGYADFEEASRKPDFELRANETALRLAFPRARMALAEHF